LCAALLFLLFSAGAWLQAQAPAMQDSQRTLLPYIRERFYAAVDDEAATRELILYIQRHFSEDPATYPPVVKSYFAALQGLRGRHDGHLLRKFRFVTEAIGLMDPLVRAHPGLLEVRFLRFSFYEQIPAVFGVQHHVPEDLAVILELLSGGKDAEVPRSVRLDMIEYILGTDRPDAEQRRLLLRLKDQLG
jgi:hypothetical protein